MITLVVPELASVPVVLSSPPSWSVQLCLEEKELSYTTTTLSYIKGEHRTPEMLARNPRGTLPILSDGPLHLSETLAILLYLEEKESAQKLFPVDSQRRGVAYQRLVESDNLKKAGMALFRLAMQHPHGIPNEEIPTHLPLWKTFEEELHHWESYLQTSRFVTGNDLSLADLLVTPYLATAQWLGVSLSAFPSLSGYLHRMQLRTSMQRTWPTTWQDSEETLLLRPLQLA